MSPVPERVDKYIRSTTLKPSCSISFTMAATRHGQDIYKIPTACCILTYFLLPTVALADCACNISKEVKGHKKSQSTLIKYKVAAIGSILTAGGVGVSIPLLGRRTEALRPENDIFFMIKAFTAGVILATGFIHILPDGFQILTSPCLEQHPWRDFPFAGLVAMLASIATLMIETWATGFYNNMQSINKSPNQVENADQEAVEVAASPTSNVSNLVRQRTISQVLELGIVVHSLVIGMTLGSSGNLQTIKPLLVALSFHQFFEGMGLGSCISQAKFKSVSTAIMAVFFSLTAPVGIGIGIGISSAYNSGATSSKGALVVEGIFNSASAGILIYMALVDLLAADFTNPRIQNNVRLQLGAQVSLLLGAGCMSVLAMWA